MSDDGDNVIDLNKAKEAQQQQSTAAPAGAVAGSASWAAPNNDAMLDMQARVQSVLAAVRIKSNDSTASVIESAELLFNFIKKGKLT